MIPQRRAAIDLSSINRDLPHVARTVEGVLIRRRATYDVTAEVYVPEGRAPFPSMLYMHGGAYCVWSAKDVRRIAMRLAAAGHVVLSVDYGLAPEHPFPHAVEDAVYASRWLTRNAAVFGGAGGSIAIGGDSCGAALACAAILFLGDLEATIDEGDLAGVPVEFSAALLHCGGYDFASRLGERETTPGTTEIMLNLAYLGTRFLAYHRDPLVSPRLAPNLDRFPPVYLNVGSDDALLRQSLQMCQTLAERAVPTTLSVVEGVDHEFLMLDPALPHVDAEWQRLLTWLCAKTGATPDAPHVRVDLTTVRRERPVSGGHPAEDDATP